MKVILKVNLETKLLNCCKNKRKVRKDSTCLKNNDKPKQCMLGGQRKARYYDRILSHQQKCE